ncbi:hypothetical protein L9F63_021958 [Diploptera punctata]|uniref:Odorant-binding protein n=1 Tax=Diploptera punctata TaxID=6984 RepID=A0AAD7ZP92_DIPPU|nr:hypothetical protein L9F63_021958 [Diploptera punctata]
MFNRIILLLALCYFAQGDVEKMEAAEKICQEKYHVTDDIFVKNLADGETYEEFDITLKDETNEDHRCYVECLMTEFGFIDNGIVELDALIALAVLELKKKDKEVEPSSLKTEVVSCTSNYAEEGQCIISYHAARCLFAETRKHFES